MDEGIKNLPNGVQLRVTFPLMKKSVALFVSSDAKNIIDNFKEIVTMSSFEDESTCGLGTIYVRVWSLESTTGLKLKKAFMSFSFHSWQAVALKDNQVKYLQQLLSPRDKVLKYTNNSDSFKEVET